MKNYFKKVTFNVFHDAAFFNNCTLASSSLVGKLFSLILKRIKKKNQRVFHLNYRTRRIHICILRNLTLK
jgi:hypothetical protein